MDSILEIMQDGIYIADGEANTVYVNHSYELISGLRRSEMIGRNMKDLVEEGVISVSGTLSVLKTGESITIDQSFRTGKRAVITSSPVYGDEKTRDTIIMVVTIVREITELYSIRREMQRLNEQNHHLANEVERLSNELNGNVPLVAVSASSIRLLQLAERVAMLDAPVLICGENGVGKEELARYIHRRSGRSMFPFVRIDWTMVPGDHPERVLFGEGDPGTNGYTTGLLEHADGGCVFVDEIAGMPDSVKGHFLSLLRSGSCMLQDGTSRKMNIRFLFSSTYSWRELREEKMPGEEILNYLSAFPMEIRPLRERREDIIPLSDHFLKRYNRKTGEHKRFSMQCYKALLRYDWPENVWEVRTVTERAAIISRGDEIEEPDLMLDFMKEEKTAKPEALHIGEKNGRFTVHEECRDLKYESSRLEAFYMSRAFEKYHNIRDAAASLGIDSSTFVRKRQRYKQMGLMEEE